MRYAIEDADEAIEYLRHPLLGPRLAEAIGIVRRQSGGIARIPLRTLMGSTIDCQKLVSCLTLFARVGREEAAAAALVADAEAVLGVAAAQGFPRCTVSAMA